jgi:ribosomal protein S1
MVTESFRPGTVVEETKVLSLTDFGAFVRISAGIEALIPQSEVPPGVELKVGEAVKAEIMNIDGVDRRITMSLRNVGGSAQAEQVQALNREKVAGRPATLGDLLREKLGDKLASIVPGTEEKPE